MHWHVNVSKYNRHGGGAGTKVTSLRPGSFDFARKLVVKGPPVSVVGGSDCYIVSDIVG